MIKQKVNVAVYVAIIFAAIVFVSGHASAYSPGDGAWLPQVKETKLPDEHPNTLGTLYLKCKEKLIPNKVVDGIPIYSGYPIAYFAKAHNESTEETQYAILYYRKDARIAGDPGTIFMATIGVSKGGRVDVERNMRFGIGNYADEKTCKALGGFSVSNGWKSEENFAGSDLREMKERFEKAAKELEGYSIKPICYLANQFRIERVGEEDANRSAILCNVKDEKNNAYATQVVILKWKDDDSIAEIENMTSVLADNDFKTLPFGEVPPLTVKQTKYNLGTFGTGLIAPPYHASNELIKAVSSDTKVVSTWVNREERITDENAPEEFFFLHTLNHTPGTATVTLTDIYGQSIELSITVVNNWPAPSFEETNITMNVGESKELKNSNDWGNWIETIESSDSDVATASVYGKEGQIVQIVAKKAGNAVITAKTAKDKETKIYVEVKDPNENGNGTVQTPQQPTGNGTVQTPQQPTGNGTVQTPQQPTGNEGTVQTPQQPTGNEGTVQTPQQPTGNEGTVQPPQQGEGEQITQKAGVLKVKTKKIKVKYAKLRNKSKVIARKKVFLLKKATGKLSYKKVTGNKRITVYKDGKVKIKRGIEKGSYKVKVRIAASGSKNYTKVNQTVILRVVVR